MTRVLVLNGPNLGRLGSREPEVYGAATHADLVDACTAAGAELGLAVEVRQTDDESELVGWLHEAADAAGPGGPQPGGVHPLLLRAARRLRRAHGTAGRGAPDQPGGSRGVPAHLGRRRRRDGDASPASAWTPTGSRCARWPPPSDARDDARRPARTTARPDPRRRCRGGAGDPPGQRPLPDRLHRLERRAAGAATDGAVLLHGRPLPDPGAGRRRPGSSCWSTASARRPWSPGRHGRRPAARRSRPTTSASRRTPTLRRPGRRSELVPLGHAVEELRTVKDDGELALLREACAIGDRALARAARPTPRRARPSARSPGGWRPRWSSWAPTASPSRRSWRPARTARSRTTSPTDREIVRGDLLKIDFGALLRRLPRRLHPHRGRRREPGRLAARDLRRRTPRRSGPVGTPSRSGADAARGRRGGPRRRGRGAGYGDAVPARSRSRRRPGDPRGPDAGRPRDR